jgi:ribonuclease Z
LFREKPRALKVNKDVIAKYRLKSEEVVKLKRGEDIILENGDNLTSAQCTEAPPAPRSFAYCSDTIFDQGLVPILEGVNLLYHESTFLETEVKRAKETFHSTASQAATIAKMCGAGQLLLGHYSSRYENEESFLSEAKAVFENSLAGQEGETYLVV